jgi:peptide/nickel transport system permease protein
MSAYLIRRAWIAIVLMLIVSLLVFMMMRGLPGDPARIALGEAASAVEIEAYRVRMGLNLPLPVQYWNWIVGIVTRWDFGLSVLNARNVSTIISERLPRTLLIGIPSIMVGVFFGILVGVVMATRRGGWLDQLCMLVVNSFLGTPRFLIAIFGVLILGMQLGWIPLQGYTAPWDDFGKFLHKAFWPIMVNSLYVFSVVARYLRTNLLEVMNQDFIRTARANGLSERRVIYGHAIKNALIPVITIIGLQMPQIVGGSVIVESIFNIPGIGQLVLSGILDRDYLVVQAAVLAIAAVTITSNLVVDVAYAVVDPRIRKSLK